MITELRRKGRSPNTVYGYERVYERNVRPTLGKVAVTKVNTKMLTDLYGAHQSRGLSARSVYQVHACISSMSPRHAGGAGATPTRRMGGATVDPERRPGCRHRRCPPADRGRRRIRRPDRPERSSSLPQRGYAGPSCVRSVG